MKGRELCEGLYVVVFSETTDQLESGPDATFTALAGKLQSD